MPLLADPMYWSGYIEKVGTGTEDIINETYDALQKDIIEQIHKLEIQLQKLNETSLENEDVKEKLK